VTHITTGTQGYAPVRPSVLYLLPSLNQGRRTKEKDGDKGGENRDGKLRVEGEALSAVALQHNSRGSYASVMEGELALGPAEMLVSAIVILIPLVMAVLTLTLKHSINRWLNIILGIVIAILYLVNFFELITTMPALHILIVNIGAFIAPALIVWYSWKWKT